MVNKHGIEWVVIDHSPLPTVETISRWNRGALVPSDDLYPVVKPLNLSPKLTEFLETIDRCTTKSFAVVDTMPGRRKDGHTPGANHIDTLCHPETNIIYLDVARVSEAVIAHELGHAWLQYVEQCEDLRTSSYDVDPARARMVSYVQSYVLDLRVNALLREKGFDIAVIEQDQATSLEQLCEAFYAGYEPESPREEVFMALLLADAKVRMSKHGAALVRESRAEIAIRAARPRLDKLAATFAEAAARNGHDSAQAVEQAINECLLAAFAFTGEDFDPNVDLVKVDPPELDRDKFPKWLPGFLPQAKCEVGRHMALNGVTSEWHGQVEVTRALTARVTFTSPDRTQRSEVTVDHAIGTPIRFDGIPEQLAEMLELQKKNAEQRLRRFSPTVPQPPSPPAFPGRPQPGFGTGQMRRNYMAGTGRFLTAVRQQQWLAGEHPYGYALNDPVSYIDPSGLSPRDACQTQEDKCLDQLDKIQNRCTRKATNQYAEDIKNCLKLIPVDQPQCFNDAYERHVSAIAVCGARYKQQAALCKSQYDACKERQAAIDQLFCIEVALVGTYCVYRVCKAIVGVAVTPATGPGGLLIIISP